MYMFGNIIFSVGRNHTCTSKDDETELAGGSENGAVIMVDGRDSRLAV